MTRGLEIFENLIGNEIFISLGRIQGKKQFANNINVIKKELKALEIIKEKKVCVWAIVMARNVDEYNFSIVNEIAKPLTKEEYDLLKAMLL